MRTLVFCALVLLAVPCSASIVPIPGLYNTGVDNSGQPLLNGVADPHYVISSATAPAYSGGVPVTYADLTSLYAVYPGSWTPNRPSPPSPGTPSQWIGPVVPMMLPVSPSWDGDYTYVLTFNLTGLDAATAIISGLWASDNGSQIFINNTATGYVKGANGYNTLDSFTINAGFLPGLNELRFVVNNETLDGGRPNPTGLQVANLAGTAAQLPEPFSFIVWAGLAMTIGGLACSRQR
jgi:hypothetical protein